MQKMIIDRFEGTFAVCEAEDKIMINIERSKMPKEVKEGSCICMDEHGFVIVDTEREKARKERIQKMMGDLFE